MSESGSQAVEKDQAAANDCEHFYMWSSPAGSRHSARLCMGCHSPDPEWLNKLHGESREVSRNDVLDLADAFVRRMKWPSMHWETQRLDPDAAYALAVLALESAPQILATAQVKREALDQALRPAAGCTDPRCEHLGGTAADCPGSES